jgi:hypothetical protein
MRTRNVKSRRGAPMELDQETCSKVEETFAYATISGLPLEEHWRYVQEGRFIVRPDKSFFIATKAVGRARVAAQAERLTARARSKSASERRRKR